MQEVVVPEVEQQQRLLWRQELPIRAIMVELKADQQQVHRLTVPVVAAQMQLVKMGTQALVTAEVEKPYLASRMPVVAVADRKLTAHKVPEVAEVAVTVQV